MPSAGKLDDADIVSIGPGLIRLDLLATVAPDHLHSDRSTTVIDLHTARAMTVLLINAIKAAEVAEAIDRKKK